MKTLRLLLVAGIALGMIAGCAPKARKAGGKMDDPPTHYKQGMKYWDMGKYAQAEEEFNLAKSLDPKYAPAYAGLALTTAQKASTASDAETAKNGFKEAIKLADKAQELNSELPLVFIAKAIVITMQNEGIPVKEWLRDVEKQYEKALKLDPENSECYYRRGVCYKKAYEFSKAVNDFRKVLDLNKEFTQVANEEWELVQKIERAAPGTDVGKKIALVEKIGRADLAALFISELKIDKLVTKKRPANYDTDFEAPTDQREMKVDSVVSMPAVTDIDNHWAKNFITDIVELNIRGLEPYPDHTFHPDQLVTRGEYALVVEEALIAILGDASIATKYVGTDSRFPDVNASHPVYNAICNAVDKGVMDAAMDGMFGPDKPVSGPDALLVIRKLKDLNKIE
ncbi:MAG: tetratricopeptide repeat protein [Fibrobacter sp.]|nr:tetratricopeptide repeat protein [Fibrobacter sp.]